MQSPPLGHPRDLDLYAHRLENLKVTIPMAIAFNEEQRRIVPTLRAAAYDDTRGATTVPDPTLGTVLALDVLDRRRIDILDAIAVMGTVFNMAEKAVRAAMSTRAHIPANEADHDEPERCIGDGTAEGATCHQIPALRPDGHGGRIDDGRCLDCGVRYDQALAEKRAQRAEKAAYMRTYMREARAGQR